MNIKTLKRAVRRLGHRCGVIRDWEQLIPPTNNGIEYEAAWYDRVYESTENYLVHYTHSSYYFIWTVIADRLFNAKAASVLEIGCGPGQFATMLRDEGVVRYTGLDFSPTGVEQARRNAPEYEFIVGDARISEVYETVEHDAIVCTEVLEHIIDDLVVVSRFAPGKRCLCTVPNFPYLTHVRHFNNNDEVVARYGRYFEHFTVRELKGTRSPSERFFLFDGVRNTFGRNPPDYSATTYLPVAPALRLSKTGE